jgi:hypothetical protein
MCGGFRESANFKDICPLDSQEISPLSEKSRFRMSLGNVNVNKDLSAARRLDPIDELAIYFSPANPAYLSPP